MSLSKETLAFWDYEKNKVDPDKVSSGSKIEAFWLCSKGHSWSARVQNMVRRNGCPFCTGKRVWSGYNDLQTLFPHIAKQMSPINEHKATDVTPGSGKMTIWICDRGHEWKSTIHNRTKPNRGGCPTCQNRKIHVGENDLATTNPELVEDWSTTNDLDPTEVSVMSGYRATWVCSLGHEWDTFVYHRTGNKSGCPTCAKKVSKSENDVATYIKSFNVECTRNSREIISQYEVDMFLPEYKIAIEFNGLFWHSSKYREPGYHHSKWKLCSDSGIQLITIWEDDWRDRQEIVKKMLIHKLGLSREKRIYARKTTVEEVSLTEIRDFQNEHHIQGYGSGKYKLGLRDEGGDLVATATFKRRSDSEIELVRYCTSAHVVGGQSKILSWVDKNVPYDRMVTFADLCVSDGRLYESTGWTRDGMLKPDYSYVVSGRRIHKFNYRLKRFKDDPSLRYMEGMSESQLAEMNGIHRIYDCGKIRYVRTNDK